MLCRDRGRGRGQGARPRLTYPVRLDPLPTEQAVKWLLHRAVARGVNLDGPAAEHLVQAIGSDLAALSSELAKLASLPADEPLTPERVGQLIGVRQGETQWDWRAAILEGQTGRAITLLPAILAQPGMSGVKLVTLLGTTLIGLGIARRIQDKGLRGRALEDAVFKALLKNGPLVCWATRKRRLAGRDWPIAGRPGGSMRHSRPAFRPIKRSKAPPSPMSAEC